MKKSVMTSIIAIVAALTCLLGFVGCERKRMDDRIPDASLTRIDSGDIRSNTGLETSMMLNQENGKYVNLYVENNGSHSVVATINGQSERAFKAGEKGYIHLEVTQDLLGLDREYDFKVVPGTNGGSIDIHYEIAQDLCYYPENSSR
jgi:hypothetical protein